MKSMLEKKKYSPAELEEFRVIIEHKIEKAKYELAQLKKNIDSFTPNKNVISEEDSTEVEEREQLNELSIRQQKFLKHLEGALERIKKGTYGVCVVTGKLIEKERLLLVPHTTHSVEAKEQRKPVRRAVSLG